MYVRVHVCMCIRADQGVDDDGARAIYTGVSAVFRARAGPPVRLHSPRFSLINPLLVTRAYLG